MSCHITLRELGISWQLIDTVIMADDLAWASRWVRDVVAAAGSQAGGQLAALRTAATLLESH